MKNSNQKTFNEVLDELNRLLEEDFIRFREELKKLSVREKMDTVFENPLNSSTFVDDESNRQGTDEKV